ncbi:MAG: hypothetical protein WBL63_05345 [Candidatus Acidiferrum sp.]
MSTLDVLILIPLIPVAPVVITWWLPWERWIPWDEFPKSLLGPYVLYAAFAAWHFKLAWWEVAILVLAGTVLSVIAVIEKAKKWKQTDRAQ